MRPRLKLGFDNYSIRALGWKAPQLLDYAATLRVDAIFFSDLDVFESHDEDYLCEVRQHADRLGLEIQAGTLSICPSSVIFTDRFGTAEEQLKLTIRIAKSLGSPIARCVLGRVDDRKSPGGISARIQEAVRVLGRVRPYALDMGIRIAVENHSGDMQARELITLIESAGCDFVGAAMDSGNAVWAMEDPLWHLEILGPHAVATGIRDSVAWRTIQGAMLQWMAMGEGVVDFATYFKRYAEICPNVPVQLEIISGRRIPIAFREDGFWEHYPEVRARDFMRFLRFVDQGSQQPPHAFPEGAERLALEQEFQRAELERSIKYCREVLGLGLKE